MDCNEWLPSMYFTEQINIENKLDKYKEKLANEDYLIYFFKNEIIAIELKALETHIIMQNIRTKMIELQENIINSHHKILYHFDDNNTSLITNNEKNIMDIENRIEKLNLFLIKNELELDKLNNKIERINELIQTRKTELFNEHFCFIKHYLIDDE